MILGTALAASLLFAAGCESADENEASEAVLPRVVETPAGDSLDDAGETPDGRAGFPVAEGVEDSADAVLRAAGELLASAQRFTFHVEITEEEFLASGQMVDSSRDGDVAVRRPNGLYVERRDAGRLRRLFYDGSEAAILDVDANLYVRRSEEVPGDLDGFLDMLVEELNVPIPLADVVVADPYASFTDPALSGVDLGTSRVRGTECRHLAFTNGEIEWQIWVAAEGDPVLRKVVIHYSDEPGEPRWEAVLSDWDLSADVPDGRFAFTPPEGSHQIAIEGPRLADGSDADGSADRGEE